MGVATLTEKQRLAMEALKGARGEGARGHTVLRSGIARSRNGNNVLYPVSYTHLAVNHAAVG